MTAPERQSRVDQAAEAIRRDIRGKSLKHGDAYLTAIEAGALLDVSPMTANRAMNRLVEQGLLVRKRRKGTFVGPGVHPSKRTGVVNVHYFCVVDPSADGAFRFQAMVRGLRQVIPTARLQLHHMESHDSIERIQEEIRRIRSTPAFGGVILSMGTREMQKSFADMKIPAVMHGSVYPGVSLPSVEVDMKQAGRLMVELAADFGATRLSLLSREYWRQGDTTCFEGIVEATHDASLPPTAVRVHNLPPDRVLVPDLIEQAIRGRFEEDVSPLGILCRTRFFAETALAVIDSLGSPYTEKCRVIAHRAPHVEPDILPTPRVESAVTVEEEFAALGNLLSKVAAGEDVGTASVRLPAKKCYCD